MSGERQLSNIIPIKKLDNKVPIHQPVHRPQLTVDQRKVEFDAWTKLRPVYFHTWMWEVACQRSPDKYKMYLPKYQGQRVVLT